MALLRATLAVVLASHAATAAAFHSISVYATDGILVEVTEGALEKKANAVATFDDKLEKTGWGILDVRGQKQTTHSDSDMLFAAGAAEGIITANRIRDHHANMMWKHFHACNESDVLRLKSFMESQYIWSKTEVLLHPADATWIQVGNVLAQFDGLVAGYNFAASLKGSGLPKLTQWDFSVLNGDGDFNQLVPLFCEHKRPQWDKMSNEEADLQLARNGRCSALVKVAGDGSDLFMGHTTWYTYLSMNRIYKNYYFDFKADVAARGVSFSSYPGYLESLDDFYMMDSGLGMVQTSIDFTNQTMWGLIKPESLLAWQRVRTAHVVAHDGAEWHRAVSTAYSGTYCNQYMIVDFNKFTPGKALVDDTLWIVEEIPGQIPGGDVTEILTYGYWPSYNVPYFPEVYAASGMQALADRGVPSASYQYAPRALLFRRDSTTVTDLASFKAILGYNAYKTDPYSKDNPTHAICARGDLLKTGKMAFGCTDGKVTHYKMFKKMSADVLNGPTRGGKDNLTAFSWSEFPQQKVVGLPKEFAFDYISVSPRSEM
eukprot:Rhum_TRINITY_DN7256_c0_g1::Rhum_TRINITY_DN7256_c0_g1_i1::g.22097::m.22097